MPIAGLVAGALTSGINQMLSRDAKDYENSLAKDLMQYQFQNFMSPQAQAMSYARAGFNPALAMGPGGSGAFASPSPSFSPSPISFVSGIGEMANAVQAIANAKKAGAETEGQVLENKVLEGSLKERIEEVGLRNKWTQEETSKIINETSVLVGQCNMMQKQVEKLESEKALTDKEVAWFDRHMKAEIDDLEKSADYKEACSKMTDAQRELLDATFDDLAKITNLNAQQLEKVVALLDKYGDAQAIVGMLTQIVSSASGLIGSIAGLRSPKIPTFNETRSVEHHSGGSVTHTVRTGHY